MTDTAKKLLGELYKAKEQVKLLEAEYKKHCECNEYIGGVKPDISQKNQYIKTHKTCKYHEVRMYHCA